MRDGEERVYALKCMIARMRVKKHTDHFLLSNSITHTIYEEVSIDIFF
jgi:hypothetical protein